MGKGAPLEVGGEGSYSDHPDWYMASVTRPPCDVGP
jgi:hypothetical protein